MESGLLVLPQPHRRSLCTTMAEHAAVPDRFVESVVPFQRFSNPPSAM